MVASEQRFIALSYTPLIPCPLENVWTHAAFFLTYAPNANASIKPFPLWSRWMEPRRAAAGAVPPPPPLHRGAVVAAA